MTDITIIEEESRRITAYPDRSRSTFLVDADDLPAALGWELGPSGLCQGEQCVPVADPRSLHVDGRVDLSAVAGALGRHAVVDVGAGVMALSLPTERRRRALDGLVAPGFALPDLMGTLRRLDDWSGTKRLLVAFSSWCGCRYDLPGWQSVHDELAPYGFTVIAVALDRGADDVLPWTDGITMPVLYDPEHLLTELYAISNVPSVVWIDEEGRIVRPTGAAHASDLFAEFTGVEAGPHLDQLRRWVKTGVAPLTRDEARVAVADLSDDEVRARLHFRVACEARRRGDAEATHRHLETAAALAPDDLTIWRAAMPLVGEDPFGDAFLARYEEWRRRGSPAHGLPPVAAVP
ncbi:MAG TPA: TlpA disulfide reductase family protein [Acidimicrobiales bacterium]|nr:TlpA disulfide reductase family protein [Acidimicrobiales bacterium]